MNQLEVIGKAQAIAWSQENMKLGDITRRHNISMSTSAKLLRRTRKEQKFWRGRVEGPFGTVLDTKNSTGFGLEMF